MNDTEQLGVHVRWMIRRDMPEVIAIESDAFDSPWPEDEFIACLRQRHVIGMVAERDNQVLGYSIYELHKKRIHIVNFAVHAEHRRQSVGTQIVRKLVAKLSSQRRNRIMLEVRDSNLDAHLFFRACGFRATAVLQDYFDDSTDDAYVMEFRLAQHFAAAAAMKNRISQYFEE